MMPNEDLPPAPSETLRLCWLGHLSRVASLVVLAALLLGWLASHTEIFFADGLRYISQAQGIERGPDSTVLKKAVDHPIYPLTIALVHRWVGGIGPQDWQFAAQLASALAGLALILPLYLSSRELFGDKVALPACLLFLFAVPLNGHVFADTLSESTFLLFWLLGLWAALCFFRTGRLVWLPLLVVASGLAYLTRPEGLLLPAATLATLGLSPRWVYDGLGKRGVVVLGVLILGGSSLVGPYIVLKGGLGTKPSVARLLGKAPQSAAQAVERSKPLDPDQSAGKTHALAVKAVVKAVGEAVTWPLMALAAIGLGWLRPRDGQVRQWRLLAVIGAASFLALVRLHETGGYCSARHAMIVSTTLIPTAAFGLCRLIGLAASLVSDQRSSAVRCAGWALSLSALAMAQSNAMLSPVNDGFGGYKEAGHWLTERTAEGGKIVDVTGWAQFYSGRAGYTFEDLIAAPADPTARWVVVREAHLKGPWDYCGRLRSLVKGHSPVVEFQGQTGSKPTRVLVFDRFPGRTALGTRGESPLRR